MIGVGRVTNLAQLNNSGPGLDVFAFLHLPQVARIIFNIVLFRNSFIEI